MPRSPTGTYTLPLAPVISGEVIEATWANQTLADMAAALTDSLSRSQNGNMQEPLLLVDGVKGAPGLAFVNEAGTGFYRPDAGDLYLAVLGVDYMRWTDDNGVQIFDDPNWYDVIDSNQLTQAIDALQVQITANTDAVADLGPRVQDLEDNVTPDPIVSPNFRSAGSIRHLLNKNVSLDVSLYNRTMVANTGAFSITFSGLPTVIDPNLGNVYQVEGQVVVYNGGSPGAITINGITPTVTMGAPSLVANQGSVLTYLIQYDNGAVTSTFIWSAG